MFPMYGLLDSGHSNTIDAGHHTPKMMLKRRLFVVPVFFFCLFAYHYFYASLRNHAYSRPEAVDGVRVHLRPRPEKHPITSYIPQPSGQAKDIPSIQFDFTANPETKEAKAERLHRQGAVKDSFRHAWSGYREFAWGRDEVAPISHFWRHSFGGWGATLIDSMDTLWMMGLTQDFEQCVAVVKDTDFTTNVDSVLNVFETTIRYLGGLMGAYEVSEKRYPVLLEKAKELGDVLYMAFDTPAHMPVARWEWKRTAAGLDIEVGQKTLLAELGSMTLEFTRLGQLTHDPKFFDIVDRIMELLYSVQNTTLVPGLWPTFIDPTTKNFSLNHFTFGGMADSTYEYLSKEYMILGGLDPKYQTMYETAIETAKEHLFFRPMAAEGVDVLFSGNTGLVRDTIITEPQAQHLGCFVGGMVGVGSKIFSRPEDLPIARKLVDGCIWLYDQMPTGLMPEISFLVPCHHGVTPPENFSNDTCLWNDDWWYESVASRHKPSESTSTLSTLDQGKYIVQQRSLSKPFTELPDNRYILRPEAIESVFILYRITGDPALMDAAWKMFQSIEKATRTDIAHAGIYDVRQDPPNKSDRMESFWLAETLKYFYLIFSEPEDTSLDEWVFSTEAHPFKRPRAGQSMG